jgi:hypothetical protein
MLRLFSIRKITLALFLAASVSLSWQFYRMYREGIESQRAYEQYGVIVCKFGPSRDEASRMYIELFVLVAFIGVFQRGLTGTVLTVIGLTGVTIIYLTWWRYYFRLAEIAGSELQFIKHTVYLYRANYLDLSIAAATALLISLHVRWAILCFGSAPQIVGRESRRIGMFRN